MEKRTQHINLIGQAGLSLKPYISNDEFQKIMKAHDLAVEDRNGGLQALDIWDTAEMYTYEQVVRIVAEENNLTHITDPILNKLES